MPPRRAPARKCKLTQVTPATKTARNGAKQRRISNASSSSSLLYNSREFSELANREPCTAKVGDYVCVYELWYHHYSIAKVVKKPATGKHLWTVKFIGYKLRKFHGDYIYSSVKECADHRRKPLQGWIPPAKLQKLYEKVIAKYEELRNQNNNVQVAVGENAEEVMGENAEGEVEENADVEGWKVNMH